MFYNLCRLLIEKKGLKNKAWLPLGSEAHEEPTSVALIPNNRVRYLAELSEQGRHIKANNAQQSELASVTYQSYQVLKSLADPALPEPLRRYDLAVLADDQADHTLFALRQRYQEALAGMADESIRLLQAWPDRKRGCTSISRLGGVAGFFAGGESSWQLPLYRGRISLPPLWRGSHPDVCG